MSRRRPKLLKQGRNKLQESTKSLNSNFPFSSYGTKIQIQSLGQCFINEFLTHFFFREPKRGWKANSFCSHETWTPTVDSRNDPSSPPGAAVIGAELSRNERAHSPSGGLNEGARVNKTPFCCPITVHRWRWWANNYASLVVILWQPFKEGIYKGQNVVCEMSKIENFWRAPR